MQFDVSALRHALSSYVRTAVAVGGATLAVGAALSALWPREAEKQVDAVAVKGPVFTPVAMSGPARGSSAENGESAERFDRIRREDDVALTRAVQRELKRAGCYEGPVNGAWSAPTRKAMAEFTGLVNASLPVDHPDTVLLVLLESHQDVSCTPAPPKARGEEVAGSAGDGVAAEARTAAAAGAPEELDMPGEDPSAEREGGESGSPAAAAVAAGGAAALSAATSAPGEKSAALEEPEAVAPRRTRKAKRVPSIARSVQKSLKSLERNIKAILR